MSPMKIVSMVVSALLFLGGLFITGLALTMGPHWGMFVSCLALTVLLGLFVVSDVRTLVAYYKK